MSLEGQRRIGVMHYNIFRVAPFAPVESQVTQITWRSEDGVTLVAAICTCLGRNSHFMRGTWHNGYSVALCLSCSFEPRLVRDFQKNTMFLLSQSWDIVSMLWSLVGHFTFKCFTRLGWKWTPGRRKMAMSTISSMRRNGCRTVCSPWSWNGTRMNRSSDQGVKCRVGW